MFNIQLQVSGGLRIFLSGRGSLLLLLLPPATKLQEGNACVIVFTGVGAVSVQGRLRPGGFCRGVSVQGDLCQRDPLYGNVRVVRILLECILSLQIFCRKLHENERIWSPRWSARVTGTPMDPPIQVNVRCSQIDDSNSVKFCSGVCSFCRNFAKLCGAPDF